MTPDDAKKLLAHAAAFDNRQPSLIAAQAWAAALQDIPADQDAIAAVARYYGTPPKSPGDRLWIQPADVRALRRTIRSERLANFVFEPTGDDDDPQAYLAELRSQQDEIASGRRPPPEEAPRLKGGPHPLVAQRLKNELPAVGRTVPAEEEPTKRPGVLGVVCPKCRAAVGRPCRLPGSARRKGRERAPHDARKREAAGLPPLDAKAEQLEAERRREAARLATERRNTDEEAAS